MSSPFTPQPGEGKTLGIDRTMLRLAVLGLVIVIAFTGLFSRAWFLQVLASEDYDQLADENKVRLIYSEPPRGRIVDRNGVELVKNRSSRAVTVDRQIIDTDEERKMILGRLAKLLGVPRKELRQRFNDQTVSPYKPVAVAFDVKYRHLLILEENKEDFPGVGVEKLPVREYPRSQLAAHVLGYVGQINEEELESEYFVEARPKYQAGDVVGKAGVERTYDRQLRGQPGIRRVIVNSSNQVIASEQVQDERPGKDLVVSLDARIQRITEQALESGIMASRSAGYLAPNGAAVVMDPDTGEVIASASFPTYDPSILADGITAREWKLLSGKADDGSDAVMINRAIQATVPPGSTFKVPVAMAAIALGVTTPAEPIACPGSRTFPPEGGPGSVTFNNWTPQDFGSIGVAKSLEISCDTYYYELGWRMESRWGAANGDGSEKFQKQLRKVGFAEPTGIDLPYERAGTIPDEAWCEEFYKLTNGQGCEYGWLPGYTVNMSIGQGDVVVSPIQMAVNFASVVNGGNLMRPRLAVRFERSSATTGRAETLREFQPKVKREVGLDAPTLQALDQGLRDVVMGSQGTAAGTFAGFPLDRYPVAGKTGTAQIGALELDKNFAWFVSYAPADDPDYVVAVYIDRAGGGGRSAGPVARQIYEGIFKVDDETEVVLGEDGPN